MFYVHERRAIYREPFLRVITVYLEMRNPYTHILLLLLVHEAFRYVDLCIARRHIYVNWLLCLYLWS